MEETQEVTRIMVGVNESSLKGYPLPSISSKGAFEWALNKIVRNNVSAFNLLFLHVQVPDEDGSLSLSLNFVLWIDRVFGVQFLYLLFGFLENGAKEKEKKVEMCEKEKPLKFFSVFLVCVCVPDGWN